MSFSFKRSAKDRAATRFMSQVHAALVHAALKRKRESGRTQRDLAQSLDMDKATISRILSGRGNPTIRTLAELAWGLDYMPELVLRDVSTVAGNGGPAGNDAPVTSAAATVAPTMTFLNVSSPTGSTLRRSILQVSQSVAAGAA